MLLSSTGYSQMLTSSIVSSSIQCGDSDCEIPDPNTAPSVLLEFPVTGETRVCVAPSLCGLVYGWLRVTFPLFRTKLRMVPISPAFSGSSRKCFSWPFLVCNVCVHVHARSCCWQLYPRHHTYLILHGVDLVLLLSNAHSFSCAMHLSTQLSDNTTITKQHQSIRLCPV